MEDALRVQALGFKGYKDHCWRGPAVMIAVARALREAVGPGFHLMHDAVQVYNYNEAVKVGRELERQQFTWFEEPLRDFDYLGLRKLCATLEIPIAATEFLPGSLYSTAQVLALRSADIVRASNGWRGGITDHIKIAQLAEAFGVNLEITSLGSNWGFAHANLYGAIKNTTFHENNADLDRDPIVRNPLQVRGRHSVHAYRAGAGLRSRPGDRRAAYRAHCLAGEEHTYPYPPSLQGRGRGLGPTPEERR